MRMTEEAFRRWSTKRITLLGMSGVGKTTLAYKLPRERWFHYSGDYRIGTKYLEEPILDQIKKQAMQLPFLRELLRSDSISIRSNITIHNLTPIATFLGKLGNPSLGGLPLEEFKRRQRLYYEAEVAAMLDVPLFIEKARDIYGYEHFLNDAGGSICHLPERVFEVLASYTLILYLKAPPEMVDLLIRRAQENPKPLYFPEPFLDRALETFMREHGYQRVEEIPPDQFYRWIFPRLIEERLPKYQRIADRYGYTVDALQAAEVRDEHDFIELVAEAIARRERETV